MCAGLMVGMRAQDRQEEHKLEATRRLEPHPLPDSVAICHKGGVLRISFSFSQVNIIKSKIWASYYD